MKYGYSKKIAEKSYRVRKNHTGYGPGMTKRYWVLLIFKFGLWVRLRYAIVRHGYFYGTEGVNLLFFKIKMVQFLKLNKY